MIPYYQHNGITIYCGDCLDILPTFDAGIFDAVIGDPPYYKIVSADWDSEWESLGDYIEWLEVRVVELKRVLSVKGSLYIFADAKNAAYVQVMIDKYLTLLNCLVWFKKKYTSASILRSYCPVTERILFYTPQLCRTGLETVKLDINNFLPLREYFKEYQAAIGLSKKAIIEKVGQKADHCFRYNSTQWELPTKETYKELEQFPINGFLRRDYEDLRRDYEDLRRDYEDLRRTFNASSSTLDVISGPIVTDKDSTEHPTTKPLWLLNKIILTSTNEGDIIIDPFMGSGTTIESARNTGRRAVGIEKKESYCKIAVERLKQLSLFSIPVIKPEPETVQQELF